MNGYPCKNAERGCKASVIKSKDDGKYHEVENGQILARHFCKFWPKRGENATPQEVLETQKKLMSNDQAKETQEQYYKKWPKDEEQFKKIEAGISTIMEFIMKHDLMLRDMNKKVFGEDVEVIIAQLQEENAGLKEANRQLTNDAMKNAKGDKV